MTSSLKTGEYSVGRSGLGNSVLFAVLSAVWFLQLNVQGKEIRHLADTSLRAAQSDARPNVVLIVTDKSRGEHTWPS
jgi:hypothetical protein